MEWRDREIMEWRDREIMEQKIVRYWNAKIEI